MITLSRKAIRYYRARRNPNGETSTQQQQPVPAIEPTPVEQPGSANADVEPKAPSHAAVPERDMRAVWILRAKLLASLLLPVLTETLDYTVVATSQPFIASAFDRLDLQSWIGTVYVLTSTVFLPLWGYASDVFGRHNAIQFSILLFLVGSAMCTGASHIIVLLVGRGVSGIGAAGLTSVSRVILFDDKNLTDTTFQSAMLTLMYAIGYSVGPVLGGVLTSVSWRWIFAINLPISVVSSILIFTLIRKIVSGPQPPRPKHDLPTTSSEASPINNSFLAKLERIDWIGAALFIGGGILLLLALHWGGTDNWKAAGTIVSFIIGGLLIIVFAVWENIMEWFEQGKRVPPHALRNTEAMIPVSIFRNFDICACFFIGLTGGMVMFGIFYQLAIYFSVSKGQSATRAGLQLLFFTPGIGAGVMIARSMTIRLRQPKPSIILGSLITPIALGFLSWGLDRDVQKDIFWSLALTGFGVGLLLPSIGIQARFSQPPGRIAIVISLVVFFQTAGGTIGLAQLAAVLNSQIRAYIASQIRSGAVSPSDAATLRLTSGLGSIYGIQSLEPRLQSVVTTAFRHGARWAFLSLIPWCGISFGLSFFLSRISEEPGATPPATAPAEPTAEKRETGA